MPNMYIGGKCDECGATVDLYERGKHTEFHQKIDELIEWAQAVDKRLFPNMKPVFPQKPEKFGMTIKDIYPTEAGIQHDGA